MHALVGGFRVFVGYRPCLRLVDVNTGNAQGGAVSVSLELLERHLADLVA
jgi:hypothetical protein